MKRAPCSTLSTPRADVRVLHQVRRCHTGRVLFSSASTIIGVVPGRISDVTESTKSESSAANTASLPSPVVAPNAAPNAAPGSSGQEWFISYRRFPNSWKRQILVVLCLFAFEHLSARRSPIVVRQALASPTAVDGNSVYSDACASLAVRLDGTHKLTLCELTMGAS